MQISVKSPTSTVSMPSSSQSTLVIKYTKTEQYLCITVAKNSPLLPTNELYNIVIGTATNQRTGEDETAVAVTSQDPSTVSSRTFKSCIFSADNLHEEVSLGAPVNPFSNRGFKTTAVLNLCYKFSECIMKDVFFFVATQFSDFSFGECTLGEQKFYMQGAVLLSMD